MAMSARTQLSAGIAAVAATAVTLSTTIAAPVLRAPTERVVTASASPTHDFAVRLLAAIQHDASTATGGAPAAGTPQLPAAAHSGTAVPTAATPTAATPTAAITFGLPGIQNAIINTYNTVMPWVDWGVEVAQWAVGWVPWVGWVGADQIGIFYFDLIRPLITSGVYNTAFVIGGTEGLIPAIGNFINDLGYTINGFIRSEINWALSFLPPLPPLPFAAAPAAAKAAAAGAGATSEAGPVSADKPRKREHATHRAPTAGTDASPLETKVQKRRQAPAASTSPVAPDSTASQDTAADAGTAKADKPATKTYGKRGTAKNNNTHRVHRTNKHR